MATYVITGRDTGEPSLPDSILAGYGFGETFTATLDPALEAILIDAGLIAIVPPASSVDLTSALVGVAGRDYKMAAGVLRNNGATSYFQPIDDGVGGHRPQNIDSVTTSTSAIVVDYTSLAVQRVISFIAVPDEVLSQLGVTLGVSVSTTAATISVYRHRQFTDEIHYDGAQWVRSSGSGSEDVGSPFAVASFTSGVLRLTHTTIAGATSGAGHPYGVSLTPGGTTYRTVINGTVNATEINLSFVNAAGTVVTTADTNMSVYVARPAQLPQVVNPQPMSGGIWTNSNIWLLGLFEV